MMRAMLSLWRPTPVPGAPERVAGRELGGATIGLIGTAASTRSLAKTPTAFDATRLGYDPSVHRNDAVCIPLELFSRYRGLLGGRCLSFGKPGQVIVSLCRSALLDEAALAAARLSGRLVAACLDHEEAGLQDPGRPLAGVTSPPPKTSRRRYQARCLIL